MIEINLLPGNAKKKRGKLTSGSGFKMEIHPERWLARLSEKVTDKYMMGAIGAAALSVALIALMFVSQTARGALLEARERKAVQDSARYSAVLVATAKAEATRDSLYRQIAIIRSIDDMRYTWSHLMYEISNALPQYTWITSISQTSAPRSAAAPDSLPKPAASDTGAKKKVSAVDRARANKARSDSLIASSKEVSFRILGQTVDIQALTRFMKALEASPFIQNVQLTRSEAAIADGKEVTQFLLEAQTQTPPPFVVKTVPLLTQSSP